MSASPAVPTVHTAAVSWGDVPGWVSAIAAILALAAAVIAAFYVKSQYDVMSDQRDVMNDQLDVMKEQAAADREEITRQRAELAERDRLRAREQASKVEVKHQKHQAALAGMATGTFWTVAVRNASDRPIRGVRCKADVQGNDQPMQSMDEYLGYIKDIGNGPYFYQDADLRSPVPILRRDEHVVFIVPIAADEYPNPRFWLQFADDAGTLWELDSDMHLKPISERWAY